MRKAAILFANLDEASAELLLARLSADEAEQLRQAAAELGSVDAEEVEQVVARFLRIGELTPRDQSAGLDLENHATETSGHALSPDGKPPRSDDVPFRFLHEARCDQLAPLLAGEQPQTVAVVLAHLPPSKAGELLAALPESLQAASLDRLASLEHADPEVVREVEREIEQWLNSQIGSTAHRSTGPAAVASILRQVDPQTRRRLSRDVESAVEVVRAFPDEKISPPPAESVSFEELGDWDARLLARVVRQSDRQLSVLALAGSTPQFIERVLSQLTPREASQLRHALDHLGPTPLRDIESAQRQFVQQASELVRQIEAA